MWLFAPFLFSLVLSSWLPSFIGRDNDGEVDSMTNSDRLAYNAPPLNKKNPVNACQDDWVCGPECVWPDPGIFSPITVVNKSKADSVSAEVIISSEHIPGLDRPERGKLDAWAQHVFNSEHYTMEIDTGGVQYNSTAIYLPWEGRAFFVAVSGFTGCTSVVLACDCGIYIVS